MPLSEALAARHHANRPWWRRAAQHIDHRIPPTLHGRWALSLPAATAVALVAIAGPAAGGWYLTRSQSTVVDVARAGEGGGNAGEAAVSTTPPPDDDHVTPNAAASADGACRTHSWPPGTPRASATGAPAAWRGQLLRIVLVGAEPASVPGTQAAPADRNSTGLAVRVTTDAAWGASDLARRAVPAVSLAADQIANRQFARSVLATNGPADRNRAASAASVLVDQISNGLVAGAVVAVNMSAGRSPSDLAARAAWTVGAPTDWISNGPAARSLMAAGRTPADLVVRAAWAGSVWTDRISNGPAARSGVAANLMAGWTLPGLAVRPAAIPGVRADRIRGEQARVLIVRSSARLPPGVMGHWLHAPITHRFARAMAARRQACAPHTAMATSPAVAGAASASAGAVVVDVEGKVAHPGIQLLAGGSRVYEALAAAGGALPGVDVTALDLARPVSDGEQLRVGIAGAPSPVVGVPQPSAGGGAARGKRGKPAQPVNLNTATLEQLETVPDVGLALAQRIMDWRSEHGRFESVAQLRQVRGIGERKFADMRDSVTV